MSLWQPNNICEQNFGTAWKTAVRFLLEQPQNHTHNLVVTIDDISGFDTNIHNKYEQFCLSQKTLTPKQVSDTIFPETAFRGRTRDQMFTSYNKVNGLFEKLRAKERAAGKSSWGTYFRRMTHYPSLDKRGRRIFVNQLKLIIDAMAERTSVNKASFTISTIVPGPDTKRSRGAACLNYLAVQLDSNPRCASLLAVYRNHNFFDKAYGNYWGLCKLLDFICSETGFASAGITCISSHANVDRNIVDLKNFLGTLDGD